MFPLHQQLQLRWDSASYLTPRCSSGVVQQAAAESWGNIGQLPDAGRGGYVSGKVRKDKCAYYVYLGERESHKRRYVKKNKVTPVIFIYFWNILIFICCYFHYLFSYLWICFTQTDWVLLVCQIFNFAKNIINPQIPLTRPKYTDSQGQLSHRPSLTSRCCKWLCVWTDFT